MKIKLIFTFLLFLAPFVSEAQYKKVKAGVWEGTASYYHQKFNGRQTANGEIFSNKKMTCANNFLKLGTWLKVTNLKNGKSVVVKVNDRLARTNRRLVDMSRESARRLNYINAGLTKVRIEVIPNPNK